MAADLLAILGRGIQKLKADAPNEDISSWVLTEDLEVCDERSAHLPVRVPVDDSSPHCMVGGGDLNLTAGLELIVDLRPRIVVCAYGDRSDYLKSINGPTESEVMSSELGRRLVASPHLASSLPYKMKPGIVVWPRSRSITGPSNTGQEIRNIFDLALDEEMNDVALVTVGVHAPRTWTYVGKNQSRDTKYQSLSVRLFDSEEVLLKADYEKYAPRVDALRKSQSFARNWEREAIGISKIVRDVYGDAKPKVESK